MVPFNIECSDGVEFVVGGNIAAWLNSSLNGLALSAIGYGVVANYTLRCVYILRRELSLSSIRRSQNIALLFYVFIMFSLSTTSLVAIAVESQDGLGTVCKKDDTEDFVLSYASTIIMIFAILGADAILLWRCISFYKNFTKMPLWIVLGIPCVTMVFTFVLGITSIILLVLPSVKPSLTADFVVAYGCLTLLHNTIITTMIVVRLLSHRRQITRALGPQFGSQYASIIVMLIESAALVVVFDIFTLIVYYRSSPFSNLGLEPMPQVQAIAPLSIIYRVAKGSACATDTRDSGALEFANHNTTILSMNRFTVALGPISSTVSADHNLRCDMEFSNAHESNYSDVEKVKA